MARKLVSIIAPVYNEETVLAEFVKRIQDAIASLADDYEFEIILVDDGSQDDSLAVMKGLIASEPRLRVFELRSNFGQTPALQAGLDAAQGEIVVTLDADLQHFPEEIPQFLETLESGYDMVCGWRKDRAEGIIRRWPSAVANGLIRRITRLEVHDFGTTFRAYRAELVKDLRLFGEFHRFIPALGKDLGGRITEIPIKNVERPAGQSNYGIGRTIGVFLDLFVLYFFVRYMDRPMRAFGKLGIMAFVGGAGILTYLVGGSYYWDVSLLKERPGWFVLAVLLLLGSVQVMMTGIIAEILVRIHYEQGGRQVYKLRHEWTADTINRA